MENIMLASGKFTSMETTEFRHSPRDLTAVRDVDKERAFAKAEQRIDDFLDYWRSRIGDDDSPTLRARRS